MRSLENMSPLAAFCCLISVIGVCMFRRDPIIAAISLFFAVLFYICRNGKKGLRSHIYSFVFFVFVSVLNPFFYHNGRTVLFLIGDSPITLEALIYGISSSMAVISVIYWFRSFSEIMTEDKLLFVFGVISPKFALMASSVLRFVPLFARRAKQVDDAQRVLGGYKEDNIVDTVRLGARVFSGVSGWALENGIITADSMAARGYGVGRRTSMRLYRNSLSDIIFIAVVVLTLGAISICFIFGEDFAFYPEIIPPSGVASIISYALYGALCAAPTLALAVWEVKWKYLKSKI